jgi:hypothetical protein
LGRRVLLIERFFDADLLVELFEAALPAMLLEARLPTVARWIECARENGVDAPVLDLAEGELAFREGDRARSEALALQASRRFTGDHALLSQAWALAGASAHRACRDTVALEYYGRAEETAASGADHIRAVWGRFLAMVGLEREDAAASALEELNAFNDTSADGVLRTTNGELMLATMRGDIRESLERMRTNLALVERAIDPMVQSSALNSCAATLALRGPLRGGYRRGATSRTRGGVPTCLRAPTCLLYHASALWGLRQFKRSTSMLDEVRKTCGDDRFLLHECWRCAGAHLSRNWFGRSSAASLEDHLDIETTPGMRQEYDAWWGLVLMLWRSLRSPHLCGGCLWREAGGQR